MRRRSKKTDDREGGGGGGGRKGLRLISPDRQDQRPLWAHTRHRVPILSPTYLPPGTRRGLGVTFLLF